MTWRLGWAMAVGLVCTAPAGAAISFDVETGVAFGGYNDVRIPPDTGTQFSLTEDLETDPNLFVRLRASTWLGERHQLSLLIAPLTLHASGTSDRAIQFNGAEFPAGTDLTALYVFNSYRLTYRYAIWRAARAALDLGVSAKIRDAEIRLEGNGASSSKTNTGFVPLISFGFAWQAHPRLDLILDGDALAAPGGQGRAEDVFIGMRWRARKTTALRVGYRMLEGGADVEEVYNFALIHYLAVGCEFGL